MKRTTLIPALITVLCASGCSSTGPEPAETVQTPVTPVEAPPRDPVEDLLARAGRASAADAATLRLEAARRLLGRGDAPRTLEAVAPLAGVRLPPAQNAQYAWVLARIDIVQGDPGRALERLSAPQVQAGAGTDRRLAVDIGRARADALQAVGRPLASAHELAALQPWLVKDSERESNASALLGALGHASLADVQAATDTADSDDWRGWLELAVALREIAAPPALQQQRLAQWRTRYAAIPALEAATRVILPGLESGIATPKRVALLLPLSGRAGSSGNAVLQGYLAERFSQLAAGTAQPSVAVIDTAAEPGGFAAAYRRAADDGTSLVIGPLLKEELADLGTSVPVRLPTLALNFLDERTTPQPRLTSFGLDSNDEIGQLVADARAAGHQRVLLLADAGERTRRLVEEFRRQWAEASGEALGTLYLGDINEYRASLEQALLLEQSRQRARSLEQLLGMPLVSEPRRRADLDLVVMLAEPAAARSMRSLLAYLYAGDLPAWGTSLSRSTGDAREADQDLDGMRFLDMPWFAPQEAPLRGTTANAVSSGPLTRLVALGADAARLQSRLSLLDAMPDAGLAGATGELRRDATGRMHRRSDWYVVRGGKAVAERPRAPPESLQPQEPAQEAQGDAAWTQPQEPAAPPSNGPSTH